MVREEDEALAFAAETNLFFAIGGIFVAPVFASGVALGGRAVASPATLTDEPPGFNLGRSGAGAGFRTFLSRFIRL